MAKLSQRHENGVVMLVLTLLAIKFLGQPLVWLLRAFLEAINPA